MITPKLIPNVNSASKIYMPRYTGTIESICLDCPLSECKNPVTCKRYKTEYKRIKGSNGENK